MSDDPDYLFALKLQEQLNGEKSDSKSETARVSYNAVFAHTKDKSPNLLLYD